MEWADDWSDGTWAFAQGEVWTKTIERATEICVNGPHWIGSNGMVLNPERFKFWNEAPAGAMGPIQWIWKDQQAPRPSFMQNHKSAMIHAKQLGKQLDEAEQMGMVEAYNPVHHGPDRTAFACNVIPLGARVKPSGAIRMLVDPSLPGINEAMRELPCTLPTTEQIFKLVKPTSVLGKRDLLNGFFHVTLHPDARKNMGYTHPVTGGLYRWIVLPQGTKQSPAIFCAVSEAACRIFNRRFTMESVKAVVVVYVDDYIIIADSHSDMVKAFQIMDEEAEHLGLQWNPKKDVGREAPVTELEVLGIIIDAPNQMLKLPQEKRAQYLKEVQNFLSSYRHKECAPVKVVERLAGKLLFACRVCRWGYLFTQEILDQVYPGLHGISAKASQVQLTEGVWFEISFWEDILQTDTNSWSGIRKHMVGTREVDIDPSKFDLEVFTDASKTYGIGGILGHEVYSRKWDRPVSDEHIGALELEALQKCLQHWRHDLVQMKVIARMDNIQAVTAVNKGASRKPALRETLLKIASLGLEYGFEVKAVYIKGELNPADAPSRGKQPTTRQDWTFMHFTDFNNPPAEVDCCAAVSGYNVQPGCTVWYSAADPVQDHVRDIAGKVLWANAPFAELDSILDSIVAAWRIDPINTVATVVVPEWTTARWYRKYIRRKRPLFKLLHRYEIGSRVFRWKNSSCPANPIRFPILVLRLGNRA